MHMLLAPPSLDDLIRLLRAWRFWLLAALAGALLGAAVYAVFPPPYRARAVVNVDFNMEQAWPQETDRQQFYYLERETRKLEEIAWSDAVMQAVAKADGSASVQELRGGILQLSQPAEAGWHFYARDASAERARSLASAWARAFVEAARSDPGVQAGLEVAQADALPRGRSVPFSSYLLAGMLAAWFLGALLFLFLASARSLD
jgi:hypothetical protein